MRADPHGNQLLKRMYFKHGAYWYVYQNKWTRLDESYNRALKEYAALTDTKGTMPSLLRQIFAQYEKRVADGDMAKNTLLGYRVPKNDLVTAFQNLNPNEVTPSDVRQVLAHFWGAKPGVYNHALAVLRGAFELGLELGMNDYNPAKQVKRKKQKPRDRYITDAEFIRIRSAAKGQLPLIMDVLYYTGQRIGDVLALKQADIHDGVMWFVQQKTGKPVPITMGAKLVDTVKKARRGRVQALWLFSRNGKPLSYYTVHSAWKVACERARVDDAHLHDIRAKAATDYKRAGGDSQSFSGHDDAKSHSMYLRDKTVPPVPSLDAIS